MDFWIGALVGLLTAVIALGDTLWAPSSAPTRLRTFLNWLPNHLSISYLSGFIWLMLISQQNQAIDAIGAVIVFFLTFVAAYLFDNPLCQDSCRPKQLIGRDATRGW